MKLLKNFSGKVGRKTSPFKLSKGKFLTQILFTSNLKLWASPYRSKDFIDRLTGHCCRGAIPRLLASRPDLADEDDISVWGRLSSEAFKIYAKKSKMSRKVIFDKIKNIVIKQQFLDHRRSQRMKKGTFLSRRTLTSVRSPKQASAGHLRPYSLTQTSRFYAASSPFYASCRQASSKG
jgi:hypothetical protein